MRVLPGRVAPLVICLCAAPLSARAADTFPAAVTAYSSATEAAGAFRAPLARNQFAPHFDLDESGAPPTTQNYWPLLYSALVPGLGELVMGYEKRGIALMAAEAVAWTGYYKYHTDGTDERAAYEAFADKNWNFDKWINDHPSSCVNPGDDLADVEACGRASSGSGAWPGYIPFVSKEQDKQHYYENLGKYDWYISGWADWHPTDPFPHETALRTQYREMRQTSNHDLDHADNFLWVSYVARAFSLTETAILIHKRRNPEPGGGGGGSPIALRARPRGNTGGEVALEVHFK